MIRRVLTRWMLSKMRIMWIRVVFIRTLIEAFKWVRIREYDNRWFARTRSHTWEEHGLRERRFIREADALWKLEHPDFEGGPRWMRVCCEACWPFCCLFCGEDFGVMFGDERALLSV